jgi:hypothetical protein
MRERRIQHLGMALFPLGALAMHRLRYELAFGSDASRELAAHGHGYLRGGRALVGRVARMGRRRSPIARERAPMLVRRPAVVALPRLAPLARAAAGRAPPAGPPSIA